jgi:hypothetical protein
LKKVFPILLEFRKMHVSGLPGTATKIVGDGVSGSADDAVPSLPPMVSAAATSSGKGKGIGGKGTPRVRRGKDLQNLAQNAMSDV